MAFQYPWGNLQGLNLTWFINQFKKLREDWATAEAGIEGSLDAEIQKAEDALSDVFDARDDAAASATAAAASAAQAGTSATAAQNSATAAASSATLANTKATAAGVSEANAAQSASQAALSASNAGNSATQASNSATAAGNSATSAAASETAAGNSASAAATSETNAAASAQEAEDVLDSIPEDYSTLSNDVSELKSAIEQQIDSADTEISTIDGYWVGDYGELHSSTARGYLIVPVANIYINGKATLTAGTLAYYQTIVFSMAFLDKDLHIIEAKYQEYIAQQTFDIADVPSNAVYVAFNSYSTTTPHTMAKFKYKSINSSVIDLSQTLINTKAMMAKELTTMRADTALVENDFRIVNNTLYRVTAPIAAGGTLTPNTNCVVTTVGEILKSILNA